MMTRFLFDREENGMKYKNVINEVAEFIKHKYVVDIVLDEKKKTERKYTDTGYFECIGNETVFLGENKTYTGGTECFKVRKRIS